MPHSTDCSDCPIRDLGKVYAIKDERDPWRRMPKLMDQLVATFGKCMFNRRSRTRIDTEQRIGVYCQRVRATYGEPCSRDRMRICATVLMGTARYASRSNIPYPLFRAGLTSMFQSDILHRQLKATRDNQAVDLDVVMREIEHVV